MCVLSIKVPIRKKSGNLFYDPRISNIWFVNIFCRYTQLNDQTVLFLTIQFSISYLFTHSLNTKQLYLTHRCYKVLPFLGQSEPGSDGNEGILRIPQSSSITGTSPWDCLVSYQNTRWEGSYPLCREAVDVFYSPSKQGKRQLQICRSVRPPQRVSREWL